MSTVEEDQPETEPAADAPGVDAAAGTAVSPNATADPSWRAEGVRLALLFVGTRLALAAIGVASRSAHPGLPYRPQPAGVLLPMSSHTFLDIWGMWDSSWYLSVANVGYKRQLLWGPFPNYGFFPLYPWAAKVVGWPIHNSFFGGLVVSNLSLLGACWFLYRLVRLDHDVVVARRSVKYLLVAPGAFLLSAVLSESLYLVLALACFYYARTRRWWLVGGLGFLLTLARGPGVFVVLPLLWIYLQQRGFSLRRIRPDVLWLAGLPLGLALFAWISYRVTGDALAFAHVQREKWGHYLQNPFPVMWRELWHGDYGNRFNAWYVLGVLAVSLAFLRRLGVAYGVFVLVSVLMPIVYGPSYYSMVRYTVVVFPLYIVLARSTRDRPELDQALVIGMALFQGFLMAAWVNTTWLVV